MQDLLVQNVGALIFIPQDATAASAGVKAANKSDVPVVTIDEKPEAGNGKLATYIASLAGGAGSMLGTFIGLLTIGVLRNGMGLLNVSPNLQPVVIGVAIILAVPTGRRTRA